MGRRAIGVVRGRCRTRERCNSALRFAGFVILHFGAWQAGNSEVVDAESITEKCALKAFVKPDSRSLVLSCGSGMFVELPAMPGLED